MLNDTQSYLQKVKALFGSSIVGFWPQNEQSGTVSKDISGRGHDGSYTGVTLGQTGIGDGNTAASFDGTTSFNNIYSAGLNTDFNPLEGTALTWIKVAGAGTWTDATLRYFTAIYNADGANYAFRFSKNTTNGQLLIARNSGSVTKSVSYASGSPLGWLPIACTWSESADKFIAYALGVQKGATQTGLGAWGAGAILNTRTIIGALSTVPINVWSGSIGPVLLLNRAATAAEIAIASSLN